MLVLRSRRVTAVCVRQFSNVAQTHAGGMSLWKKFSLFGAVPAVGLLTAKTILEETKHGGHHERPEFVAYDHLRIRNKRFPWGNGQRSLFHNKHANALPDGYEA